MNEFLKKVLILGGELEKSNDKSEIITIINDAEILYKNHLIELRIKNQLSK